MNMRPATSPPLLKVTNLVKTFGSDSGLLDKGTSVRAVDGISFTIRQGETLGLVGETGSGKSTLGRLVLNLIEPTSGRIEFDGRDITGIKGADARNLRGAMQMVFQDPYGSLDPRMTVNRLVSEPLVIRGYGKDEIAARLESTLLQVGIDPRMGKRYPHEFSGGQRQRIGIARALVLSPKLLVLDEPVSALDVSIQAQILNLLRDIQRRTGISYLFIVHDLAVVRHISDRVAVMYLGRMVELSSSAGLYRAPRHPYTKALLSAIPTPDPGLEKTRYRIPLHGEIGSAASMPSGCSFHPRCFRARHAARQSGVETEAWRDERLPSVCIRQTPELDGGDTEGAAACHFADLADSFDERTTEKTDTSSPTLHAIA